MTAKRYHRLKDALAFANELAQDAEYEGEVYLAECALDTVEAIMEVLDGERPEPVAVPVAPTILAPFRDKPTVGTPDLAYLQIRTVFCQ